MKNNELWLIWRICDEKNRGQRRYRVGILEWDETKNIYRFWYDYGHDFLLAKKNGFAGFPGFDDVSEGKVYESLPGKLFPNIASRLPKKERDDYLDILNRYELDADDGEFEILSTTRGRQVTDNYEFVPAFNKEKVEFEVAGVDHRDFDKIQQCVENGILVNGAKLKLVIDEKNVYDEDAVKIILPAGKEDIFIGYVPRYYNTKIKQQIKDKVEYSAVVKKIDLNAKIRDEKISVSARLIFSD